MSELKSHYTTVIIGSGFGGSVVASTLTEAGKSALLVERGPWRDTRPVRSAGIARRSPLPSGPRAATHLLHRIGGRVGPGRGLQLNPRGLFDIHLEKDLTLVCSNGVGGGSHVYSAMNTRPERADYWEGHASGVSAAGMEAHYDWMLARMGSKVPPQQAGIPNQTTTAFAHSPDFVADDSVPQPALATRMLGQPGDYRNNSYLGSENGAKTTLDQALLLPAMARGLTVAAEHECLSLSRREEGGYRLELRDHAAGRRRYLTADRVVLAAGTLNTLRLLFRSRERGGLHGMPALGRGLGGNGDSVAWWALNQAGCDLSAGTPTHGRFALRDPDTGKAQPGPMVLRYGWNGIDTLPLPEMLRARLRRDAVLVAMGEDRANGRADWHRGRLRVRYRASNNSILNEIQRLFDEIARRSGKPVRSLKGWPFTVHPLGGARLADCEEEGVVDARGQVHGLPGLYIADASALPAAPGTPPSMTIAAWARHVALGLINSNSSHSEEHPHD
ncbi:MAG: GMC oxidoreductase [Pseudomonadota bacterium]